MAAGSLAAILCCYQRRQQSRGAKEERPRGVPLIESAPLHACCSAQLLFFCSLLAMSSATAAVAEGAADDTAAISESNGTSAQWSFWQSSLQQHHGQLLGTMLLHDDQAEAESMNEGEVKEIFDACDFQSEWIICGE